MSKKSTLFLLIACIVLISTFSVFAVGITNHGEHGTCPIAMGSDCSYMDNALAMANHHISGIQALSQGVTTSGLSVVLMLLSVVLVLIFIKPKDYLDNLITNFRHTYVRHKLYPVFLRILKHIALRNKLDIHPQY